MASSADDGEISLKIYGFLQIRNEVKSGHLERFMRLNRELFDDLFAIDDGSDDGTFEVLLDAGAQVYRNSESNFQNEGANKEILLREVVNVAQDGDAILWLDADEVLFCSRSELEGLISFAFDRGYDSISLAHLNLWRSEAYYRVDDQYLGLEPVRIWRVSRDLSFKSRDGLHALTHPAGLSATYHSLDFPVVHYGFADLNLIIDKYKTYFGVWQTGYPLERLLDESTLELHGLDKYQGNLGARFRNVSQDPPKPLSQLEMRALSIRAKAEYLENTRPHVTIVCLIYKSLTWLEFSYRQALLLQREFPRGFVDILFVANDPTPEVEQYLRENHIPHVRSSGRSHEGEWYINSVYRSYNEGVKESKSDWVYLINSDMAFAPGALRSIYAKRAQNSFIASRLVERGVMPSGQFGVEKDFASKPQNFRERDFRNFANRIRSPELKAGGLFMPLLVEKRAFLDAGGFPEGNLLAGSLQKYLDGESPELAKLGESCIPGDKAFMELAASKGIAHLTNFDSIAYHFQEGELRHKKDSKVASGIAMVNDLIIGINGEEVLWGRLAAALNLTDENGLIFTGMPNSKIRALLNPILLFVKTKTIGARRKFRVTFSNGTFQIPHGLGIRKLVLVQDRPQSRLWRFLQKLSIALSDKTVTNDLEFASKLRRKSPIWFAIATSSLFKAETRRSRSPKVNETLTGVFVGSLSTTKGWATIQNLISNHPKISWVVISKYKLDANIGKVFPNVRYFHGLDQAAIASIFDSSNFLVSASPWETQHLVSIEAVQRDLPVFITPTGHLGYRNVGNHKFGMVSEHENFQSTFETFLRNLVNYQPANWWRDWGFDGEAYLLFEIKESLRESFMIGRGRPLHSFLGRLKSYAIGRLRFIMRRVVVPGLIKVKRMLSLR